jgi:hypothetical protein
MQNRKLILILGKTGCGKTVLANSISEKADRIIILDPLFEYDGLIFIDAVSLCDYFLADEKRKTFRCVCRFQDEADYNILFRLLWYVKDVLLLTEETSIFLNPRSPDEDFLKLINFGRHKNISLICVGRRIPEVSIYFRAQATSMITFTQTEPSDLLMLENLGFNSDEVSALDFHEFLVIGEKPREIIF